MHCGTSIDIVTHSVDASWSFQYLLYSRWWHVDLLSGLQHSWQISVHYPSCSLSMCWYQIRSPYSFDFWPIWTAYTFPLGQNTYSCSANSCRLLLVFGRRWNGLWGNEDDSDIDFDCLEENKNSPFWWLGRTGNAGMSSIRLIPPESLHSQKKCPMHFV